MFGWEGWRTYAAVVDGVGAAEVALLVADVLCLGYVHFGG